MSARAHPKIVLQRHAALRLIQLPVRRALGDERMHLRPRIRRTDARRVLQLPRRLHRRRRPFQPDEEFMVVEDARARVGVLRQKAGLQVLDRSVPFLDVGLQAHEVVEVRAVHRGHVVAIHGADVQEEEVPQPGLIEGFDDLGVARHILDDVEMVLG